jgi:HEAT repeat protein
VPIRASAARQIETLISDLGSERADVREAAIARLTLVGGRAVDRLLVLLNSSAPAGSRMAALRILEAIADPRALDPMLEAIDTPDAEVAAAAAAAARVFLTGRRGAAAVDRLMRAAMDTAREERVRVAAVRALGDLSPATIAPLLEALRGDPSEAVRAATRRKAAADPIGVITAAADRALPDDPGELAEAVAQAAGDVSLPVLLRVIERVREHESAEPTAARSEWTRVRGRAHAALAARGSRMALYDLRESLADATSPLPVEFLAALSTAGDASCLDAIAAAYAHASGPARQNDDRWWPDRLADAFRVIVKREGLTRRHALVKRIEKRWGSALGSLWSADAGNASTGAVGTRAD